MKISVIIPAFNTEKYISECINSLLVNKTENLEIIAINDGSTDNTGLILDGFDDLRVSVIHTENKGQSSARNTGVAASTGDYIIFVDSDDKLADNAIDRLSEIIKDTSADIIFFESDVFFEDEKISDWFNPRYDRDLNISNVKTSGVDYFKSAIKANNYIVNPCLYISSRKATLGVRFKDSIIHEDNIYTTMLLLEQDITVYCIKEKFHQRRIRHGSIMTQKKGDIHLNGYHACITELISNPPKNYTYVKEEYNEFIIHMVDCFKHTNIDIISGLTHELHKAKQNELIETSRLMNQIEDLRNSTSWRVTSPIRKLVGAFKKSK